MRRNSLRRSAGGAGFGLFVFDEEHHLPDKCHCEAAILSTAPMRLGLTATAERADGRHEDLAWLVGPVVYEMPFEEAEGSTLANFDLVRIPITLNEREQGTYDQCNRRRRACLQDGAKDQTTDGRAGEDKEQKLAGARRDIMAGICRTQAGFGFIALRAPKVTV